MLGEQLTSLYRGANIGLQAAGVTCTDAATLCILRLPHNTTRTFVTTFTKPGSWKKRQQVEDSELATNPQDAKYLRHSEVPCLSPPAGPRFLRDQDGIWLVRQVYPSELD
ncbi:hypothetical protein TWF225_010981 [Orbilia oligospora]|nr:hypothetical protein TWF225_010981 [Orbilia oligospora]KAF3271597.1 hypothetical protein TWF128_000172 [Orbilia oligospora]